MKRKIHPLTGILCILIALVLAAFYWTSQTNNSAPVMAAQPAATASQPLRVVQGQAPDEQDVALGIVYEVSQVQGMGVGFHVIELLNRQVPSRLGLAGVQKDDTLFYVKGDEQHRLGGIYMALDRLVTQHKPFTLVLGRQNKQMELTVKTLGKKGLTTDQIVKLTGCDSPGIDALEKPEGEHKANAKSR